MSSTYQGGKYHDVFSAQGTDPLSKLRVSGGQTVYKEFDPVIKGYVIALSGSPATTRIQLPKQARKQFRISHSLLLFEVFVPDGCRTVFEINIADTRNTKRRVQISTLYAQVSTTPLQAKIPLTCVPYDVWVWLAVDVSCIISCVYPGQHLQYIDGVSVCGTCKVRRIATARDSVTSVGELPSSWQPPPSVPPLQLISFDDSQINLFGCKADPLAPGVKHPTHVAFGEKIPVPHHVLLSHNKLQLSKPQSHDKSLRPIPLKPKPIPITAQEVGMTSPVTTATSDTNEASPTPHSSRSEPTLPTSNTSSITVDPETITVQHSDSGDKRTTDTLPFKYRSLPHSAERKPYEGKPGVRGLGRGPDPNDDFIALEDLNKYPTILHDQANDESYDWQKYQTLSSSSSSSSSSSVDDPTHTDQGTVPLAGNSLLTSSGFDTLKKKLEALQAPCDNTLDINEMGGAHSPVGSTADLSTVGEERVELVYDQHLNCFYDPQTGKYYKLTES